MRTMKSIIAEASERRADATAKKEGKADKGCDCLQIIDLPEDRFPECKIAGLLNGSSRRCHTDGQQKSCDQCSACGGIVGLAIESGSGIGDALIVTEALHATKKAYPMLPVAVITGHGVVFAGSPDVDHVVRRPHKAKFLADQGKGFHYVSATKTPGKMFPNYGTWLKSRTEVWRRHPQSDWNNDPDTILCNAVTNTCYLVNDQTPLRLQEMGRRPILFLTPQERSERPMERPYWLVVSGAESSKEPRIELLNAVVEKTKDKVHWVQFGYDFKRAGWTCKHPTVKGVAENRRRRFPEREFFRWIYHAQGILCPEGGMSHTAAALGTPCVVLLGGRSTPGWVDYAGQSAFHTIGRMACCQSYACWTKRCKFDRACYMLIDPNEVAETVLWHDRQQSFPSDLAQSRITAPSGFTSSNITSVMAGGNRTAFLVCAGPSLDTETALILDEPGLATMAVNRAVNLLRHPSYFVMCDSWDRYSMDVWHNPDVVKFVRTSQQRFLTDWPNAIYANWKEEQPPAAMIAGPQIPLGIKTSGLRSSMCAAMSVLIRLGFKTINIVGADFDMSGKHYCDGFERTGGEIKQYLDRTDDKVVTPGYFGLLNEMFVKLNPTLRDHGIEIWNCTPGGNLDAFDRKPLEQAVREALCRPEGTQKRIVPLAPAGLVKALRERLAAEKPERILELGFGRGETGTAIRAACPESHITGIESWQAYIDVPKHRKPYDSVVAADVNDVLPTLAAGSFDVVVAMEFIEHLTREDAETVIDHCKQIAPIVYCSAPIGDFPQEALHGNPYQIHRSTWTDDDWRAMGFEKLTAVRMRNGSDCALYVWERLMTAVTASLIIPVWNATEATKQTLESFADNDRWGGGTFTNMVPSISEVIVYDNGSNAATQRMLSTLTKPSFRVVRSKTNRGFGHACNSAASEAVGDILIFLNSDVVTEGPWVDRLVQAFADPKIAAAGPSVMTWKQGGIDTEEDVRYVDGWCLAVRRAVFEEVGGFDKRFGLGYCEDADLGRSIMEAGYDVCQVDLPLKHLRKRSSRQLGKTRAALLDRNRRLLVKKWKKA